MTECDPCQHCQYYRVYYDRDIGWDYGCACPEEEFAVYDVKPCPHFKPILPSDGLYEQLANEDEQKFWEEQEAEYKERMNRGD